MTVTSHPELRTIGSVLALLQKEFPEADLTISKIRFLESEGLVSPARTPSGYRKFSHADVNRLRLTLIMQRDTFLPLRVIREKLDEIENGADSAEILARPELALRPSASTAVPAADSGADGQKAATDGGATAREHNTVVVEVPDSVELPDDVEVSLQELAAMTGLPVKDLAEMERGGWLQRTPSGEGFSSFAVEVAKTMSALREFGLDERPLGVVKAGANKQAELIMRFFETRLASKNGDVEEFKDQAGKISTLSLRLEALLIRQALAAEFDSRR